MVAQGGSITFTLTQSEKKCGEKKKCRVGPHRELLERE